MFNFIAMAAASAALGLSTPAHMQGAKPENLNAAISNKPAIKLGDVSLMGLATFALAVLQVVMAGITLQGLRYARISADAANVAATAANESLSTVVRTERSYVFMYLFATKIDRKSHIAMFASNAGTTPAFLKKAWWLIERDTPAEWPSIRNDDEETLLDRVIAAGERARMCSFPCPARETRVVFAVVEYEDIFGQRHTSRWACRVDAAGSLSTLANAPQEWAHWD